ncbi:MAG: hypothetical protein H6713_27940 [Myxococcales bacterium]|nr:hypothetical protein [Myxococcales bacterium]MCB9753792.1 hypothetical protein [Myxococcales bacterium]
MPPVSAATLGGAPPAWLRGPSFDLALIVGVLALALVMGGLACASPELFLSVLLVDLWLLAYPHVASTFTRIAFTREDVRRRWFLLFALPPLVLLGTATVAGVGGVMALSSLYFFWQSWHYTRQSYGIARAYHRRSGAPGRDRLGELVVYAFPLWGVLRRAHQDPGQFYGAPLWCPPVPAIAVQLAGALAALALVAWALQHARAPRRRGPGSLFIASHVLITVISYRVFDDITQGWLFINIWHNAQYLLFVWASNARRFAGAEPPQRFLARLCQPEHALRYALVCVGLSTAFYLALGQAIALVTWAALPVLLVVHLSVNFHHYLVDAVIWRAPRRARAHG